MSGGLTLYEIGNALRTAIDGGYTVDEETGEILFSPEDLDELREMHEEKLEACGLYLKNLAAEEAAILTEERHLHTRRKTLEAKRERLADYVLADMLASGATVETARLTMKPRRKPASVVITDIEAIPEEYRRVKIEPDKTGISKALKSGREVSGARLSEESWRLAIG